MTVQERKTLEGFLRKRLEDELTVRLMNVVTDALQDHLTTWMPWPERHKVKSMTTM